MDGGPRLDRLRLQSIVEPEEQYVLEAKEQDEIREEDDGEAGPDKGGG